MIVDMDITLSHQAGSGRQARFLNPLPSIVTTTQPG